MTDVEAFLDDVYVTCALLFGWRPKDVDEIEADRLMRIVTAVKKAMSEERGGGVKLWQNPATQ